MTPPPPAGAVAPEGDDGTTNWLAPTAAAAGGALAAKRMLGQGGSLRARALTRLAAAPMKSAAGNVASFIGSRALRPTNLNPLLAIASVAEGINAVPTMWGGDPMSVSLADRVFGTLGDEYFNQRNAMQRIDRMLPRVDPATALKLRAMKFAPTLPGNAELDALIRDFGPPSNSGMPVGLQPLY